MKWLTQPSPTAPEPTAAEKAVGHHRRSAEAAADPGTVAIGDEAIVVGLELDRSEFLGGASGAEAVPAKPAETDLGDAGLAEMFREFKARVKEQLGEGDCETRYNLGIAYKKVGLIDEAIAEFTLAARDESRLLQCGSMLGLCFMEKGMPELALKWFETALKAVGRWEEQAVR
jgi:tetratricopeptide (TPR) repeat protein